MAGRTLRAQNALPSAVRDTVLFRRLPSSKPMATRPRDSSDLTAEFTVWREYAVSSAIWPWVAPPRMTMETSDQNAALERPQPRATS